MMAGGSRAGDPRERRPWTFYALATLIDGLPGLPLRADGRHLPAVLPGTERRRDLPHGRDQSLIWFAEILKPGQMANIPVAFGRSIALASIVSR